MRRVLILTFVISVPFSWAAKLEGINFDKVLVCEDGRNFPIRFLNGDPTRVWVFERDRGGWFPSEITEEPEHIFWKDFHPTHYTLDRKTLILETVSNETQCKLVDGTAFRQIWADRYIGNQL